jgi:hypothetical protein
MRRWSGSPSFYSLFEGRLKGLKEEYSTSEKSERKRLAGGGTLAKSIAIQLVIVSVCL